MRRALALAERGAGQVAPNPKVGAVVVRNGGIIGEGWHARYGEAHAEVMALRAAGDDARGATLYVSLEPCNHHGKTPPCTEAIIASGITRVVVASLDPNPVAAGGAARLRAHGIEVVEGVMRAEADEQNAAFLHAARGAMTPWVTLKLALSIDGALVDVSRARAWLTGPASQRAVHRLRAESDAIAVGIGTALADDPALTVRGRIKPRVTPLRVVFDRHARLPLASTLIRTAREAPVLVITDGSQAEREALLLEAGAQVVKASSLQDAMELLRARGVRQLLVEGGAGLASALMDDGLVHRLIIFQAPVILGEGALAAFGTLSPRPAATAPRFRVLARRVLGQDVMTTYAVSGD